MLYLILSATFSGSESRSKRAEREGHQGHCGLVMRIRLVKTATGSTPSWMLPVFVVAMQLNY